MDVSKNRGTPKSSILIGFSIINHPFWGTTIFGNTQIACNWIFPIAPGRRHALLSRNLKTPEGIQVDKLRSWEDGKISLEAMENVLLNRDDGGHILWSHQQEQQDRNINTKDYSIRNHTKSTPWTLDQHQQIPHPHHENLINIKNNRRTHLAILAILITLSVSRHSPLALQVFAQPFAGKLLQLVSHRAGKLHRMAQVSCFLKLRESQTPQNNFCGKHFSMVVWGHHIIFGEIVVPGATYLELLGSNEVWHHQEFWMD